MKNFLKFFWFFFLIAGLSIPSFAVAQSLSLQRKAWLADFGQLKQMIAEVYPNLDVALDVRKLNLPEMSRLTDARLRQAASREDAIVIFKNFLAQFKDGHLNLVTPDTHPQDAQLDAKITAETPGVMACRSFHAESTSFHFGFLAYQEAGFSEIHVQATAFPYTTLNISGKKVGFIKIPSFGAEQYPELCALEWDHYRTSLKGVCDQKCADDFVYTRLPNLLLSELARTIEILKKQDISAMVVDVTNNGGGNDWVSAVMRMFTQRPILCGQFGFIRHDHWTKEFESRIEDLTERQRTATGNKKQEIGEELTQARSDLVESKKRCDRMRIWTDASFRPVGCDQVVKRQLKSCEVSDDFHFQSGIYSGPLFVLVNHGSASATEDLVGRLKESGAAIILGNKTYGAGCGYTNNGINLRLKNLDLVVKISDCARYMRSGVNEVAGIAPDIELPEPPLGTLQLTSKLREVLEKNLK